MSIITQCPQCTTQFRVSPQQLRVSQGWVRCGHCDAVFDAPAHTVRQRATPPPDTDMPAPLRVESPAPEDETAQAATAATPTHTLFAEPAASEAAPAPRWHSRLWLAAAVVLAWGLGVQWVAQEKEMLAARAPALRPALRALCGAVGCVIKAPRTPEFLQIESSAYDPLGEGIYRLSLTLRNTAHWPVAFPAVELTVTDASEKPMARRILPPDELGVHLEQMEPLSVHELKVYLHSTLPIEPGLSGYRLTAFYP